MPLNSMHLVGERPNLLWNGLLSESPSSAWRGSGPMIEWWLIVRSVALQWLTLCGALVFLRVVVVGDSARVADVDVWRAAKQIIELYPNDPEMAAAQRADSAYEQGDMLNFDLWTRITKAVTELERVRPTRGQPIQ